MFCLYVSLPLLLLVHVVMSGSCFSPSLLYLIYTLYVIKKKQFQVQLYPIYC